MPRFIKQCIQIIEAQGLKIEGIYRVSGKKDVCLELQDQYDQGQCSVALVLLYAIMCMSHVRITKLHCYCKHSVLCIG